MLDVRATLLLELQHLTGIMTTDYDYLVYHLLKDGSHFEGHQMQMNSLSNLKAEISNDIDAWFADIKEESL